eukprot:2974046-Amphidinium_carterae.3
MAVSMQRAMEGKIMQCDSKQGRHSLVPPESISQLGKQNQANARDRVSLRKYLLLNLLGDDRL